MYGFDKEFCISSGTNSIGIYQVIPKASGKGTKRKGAFLRIKGFASEKADIYLACEQVILKLNSGEMVERDFPSASMNWKRVRLLIAGHGRNG